MTDNRELTGVRILPTFTCAGCGGQFTESHCCPTLPWGNTAPEPIFVPVTQWTVSSRWLPTGAGCEAPETDES